MIPPQEEVEEILKPYHQDIVDMIQGGWKDYIEATSRRPFDNPRTRSNAVWDFIVQRGKKFAVSNPQWVPVDKQNTTSFILDGKLMIRFKKGDEKGFSSNVVTNPDLGIPYHAHQLPLLDLPEIPRIEVVYVRNRMDTNICLVLAVARNQEKIVWTYPIPMEEAKVGVTTPLPSPVQKPQPLVTLRGEQEKKTKEISTGS